MLYLNITVLLLIIIPTVICFTRENDRLAELDRKEHKLYFLYPLSRLILRKTHLESHLLHKSKAAQAIKALSVNNKPELQQRLHYDKRVSTVLLIILLFNLLSLMGQLPSGEERSYLNDNYLTRPEQGEGSSEVDLKVYISEDKKETEGFNEPRKESGIEVNIGTEEEQSYTEDINLIIPERQYTEEELNKVMEEAKAYLETEVLGENTSGDQIQQDLNFIRSIPGTAVTVEWFPEDNRLISEEGMLKAPDVISEAVTTRVRATLTCQETKLEQDFSFTLTPKKLTKKEELMKKLYQKLQEQDDSSSQDSKWRLPDKIDGYSLDWEENGKTQNNGLSVLLLGALVAAVLWVYGDRELENRMKKRQNQMLMDYPEIINKFTLLMNAGMTIKQAWMKIAEDYEGKLKESSIKRRYAYEEMLLTRHELKLGISESTAYEQFGRRTGVLPYMKFGSLITQNLKKGNRGLTELLSLEAMEAFKERKELAKRLGEEASTKLLGPMMIMLMIVLIIIMIPAFLSFGT